MSRVGHGIMELQDPDHPDDPIPYAGEKPQDDQEWQDETEALLSEKTQNQDPVPAEEDKPHYRRCRLCLMLILTSAAFISAALCIFFVHTRWPPDDNSGSVCQSHSTQTKEDAPVAYGLNFPHLYPDISSEPDSACRAAWNDLSSVPCHDKVFDRAGDKSVPVAGYNPTEFLPKLCRKECTAALDRAYRQLSGRCSSADTFILQGYRGIFDVQLLESGPAAALQTLLSRTNHICDSGPESDAGYSSCHVEMFERFGVVDGLKPNLEAIKAFLNATDTAHTSPTRWVKETKGSGNDTREYNYIVRAQRYGPGDGETTCSACTFEFLERTVNSWEEGAHKSPDSRLPVSLPEFLWRVGKAGNRCSPGRKWHVIQEEAIVKYVRKGVLATDWEDMTPSGDWAYLMLNGPARGDSPVKEILSTYEEIAADPALAQGGDGVHDKQMQLAYSYGCLRGIAQTYLHAGTYLNPSSDMLVKMAEDDEFRPLRERYCGQSVDEAIERYQLARASCIPESMTLEAAAFNTEYLATIEQRRKFCGLFNKEPNSWDCARGLQSFDRTAWAFDKPTTPVFLAELETALAELQRKLAPRNRVVFDGTQKRLSPDTKKTDAEIARERTNAVGNSVCSRCIWNMLAGTSLEETMDRLRSAPSVEEYVGFVRRYYATCTSLGATWLGGEPYGEIDAFWRVKEQGRVMRYVEVVRRVKDTRKGMVLDLLPKKEWVFETVYGADEETGEVVAYDSKSGERPGRDVGSLWHVLLAERGLAAEGMGVFGEWKEIEERYRREEDEKIWRVGEGVVEYIGKHAVV